ncbi:acyltransferase [Shewanella atlantica]|uniref:Acyltransferase n=1 Tax=Shewanella atlantica TaxID=271099 RepID=A0A3S0ICH8_9GAMM|nr:acyltransferase [Shewanella atlantica]RTR32527.1 acyltransferase [Shewanella atlantica]
MFRKLYIKFKQAVFSHFALLRIGSFLEKPKANSWTVLSKNTHLGRNVNFNGMRIYGGGKVIIGDNFHSGKGCYIITQVHNYEGKSIPYDDTYRLKNIEIEENVWFGMNVSVLSGCRIGEGAIVQAGSVVVSDVPKYAIIGGNPAKVFSSRDIKHYQKLKVQGCVH